MKILKKVILNLILVVFLQSIITSCSSKSDLSNSSLLPSSITVNGDRFIDSEGRHVILNGTNLSNKNKEEGYIFKGGPEVYENFKKWGINCIRYIIIWDRLEPEPGVYNEEYLEEIDERIKWAKENDIFVVLDMHQDLYSVKYSDGAPEWATLNEGKEHTKGAIWSDSYMISEAVHTSFDNFWENKPASDGIGIQDHYVNLWRHIAKRYANNATIIGFDIMNEPFSGSSALKVMAKLLEGFGQLHYKLTGEILSEAQLLEMWGDENSRMKALDLLSTEKNYDFVFSQLTELNKEFESNHLQQMYQKVGLAIREVNTKHVLFLEHSYFGNTGVASSIERVTLADGSPDPLVAYAPHGYDLVTDTKDVASASFERVKYIYNKVKEKGEQLKMPVWLGEWGAFYGNSESAIPVARNSINLIENNLFGNAYWSYAVGSEDLGFFDKVLIRPYPSCTSGELLSYHYDDKLTTLNIQWQEHLDNNAPTLIFVPWLSRLKGDFVTKKINNSDAGWIIIPTDGKGTEREILISFNKK